MSLIPIVSSMVVGIEERREFKEEQQELGNRKMDWARNEVQFP